ncbi:membrane protein [Cutibacterium acnes JCM 18909]|nr:membrane protein [Cutibacterium acnes JCM 18909]
MPMAILKKLWFVALGIVASVVVFFGHPHSARGQDDPISTRGLCQGRMAAKL